MDPLDETAQVITITDRANGGMVVQVDMKATSIRIEVGEESTHQAMAVEVIVDAVSRQLLSGLKRVLGEHLAQRAKG